MGQLSKEELEAVYTDDSNLGRLLRYSGLPLQTYFTHRFETFKARAGATSAYRMAQDFLADPPDCPFFTMAGAAGRGKTHLAISIGWVWWAQDKGVVKYWQVPKMLDWLRDAYDNRNTVFPIEERMHRLEADDLLILDDLGMEKLTEWAAERLDLVIDSRYMNRKATVIATNVAPAQLTDRIASRLSEGWVAKFECDDYRPQKPKKGEAK